MFSFVSDAAGNGRKAVVLVLRDSLLTCYRCCSARLRGRVKLTAVLAMSGSEKSEYSMSNSLEIGDRVSWSTSQGRTQGTIEERRTKDFQFDNQKFHASDDEPAFIVKSEKTGATAAHKGSALQKLVAD